MKRKIIYTLCFIFCISMYASSKEYARKEEGEKKTKLSLIKEPVVEEAITEFPLAGILCHV